MGDVSSSISHGSLEVSRRLVGTSSLLLESSLLFLLCSLLCLRLLCSQTLSTPCSSSLTSLSSESFSYLYIGRQLGGGETCINNTFELALRTALGVSTH
jgi:hypothetical protein